MGGDAEAAGAADEELAALASELAAAVERALPAWVQRSVERIHLAWAGPLAPELRERTEEAGRRAVDDIVPELRRLLGTDVDQQWTNPLSILRAAVRYPAAVLSDAGVPPVQRDEFDERHFPDDDYGLTPKTFAEIDPSLHELGLVWGAMKARAHLARRRPAGPDGGP